MTADNLSINDLLTSLCDETISPEEMEQLDRLLCTDAEARRVYLEYLDLHARLSFGHDGRQKSNAQQPKASGETPESDDQNNDLLPALGLPSSVTEFTTANPCIVLDTSDLSSPLSSRSSPLYVTHPFLFSNLFAVVVLCIGILGAWVYQIDTPQPIAQQKQPAVRSGSRFGTDKMEFVGQITGMVDIQWADDSTGALGGARVPLGRRYALASGRMEITYDTGAKVILQGPATYQVTSRDGGFLSVGKLTARLEKKGSGIRGQGAEKVASGQELVASGQWSVASETNPKSHISNPQSPIPNPLLSPTPRPQPPTPVFAVRTPTATVTDLGTEFGVDVAKNGRTVTHVFRGSVQLQTMAEGNAAAELRILRANESACVETTAGNGGSQKAALRRITVDPKMFTRRLLPAPKTIDLLDIVAGGSGLSNRHRDRGIDPTTGMEDPLFVADKRSGDSQYHATTSFKFIDGVFQPDGRHGPVQVDSAGHKFAGFPKTDGVSWGSIWSRGAKIRSDYLHVNDSYWIYAIGEGSEFTLEKRGLLGMHANAGITFDLAAIRNVHELQVEKFHATAGKRYATSADLWVIVDGQPAWKAKKIINNGVLRIAVPLKPNDRFLTLAVTDGGDGFGGDWVVFGDPVLEVSAE